MSDVLPRLASFSQVARYLGIGREAVSDLVRSGVLETRVVGRRRLIVGASVEAWLQGPQEAPEGPAPVPVMPRVIRPVRRA